MTDRIDSDLKNYLSGERKGLQEGDRQKTGYPSTEELYLFITDQLDGAALDRMITHLKNHPADQALVSKARGLLSDEVTAEGQKVPYETIQRAKSLMGEKAKLTCPHCGKPITPFKKPAQKQLFWNTVWLSLGVIAFALSFVFRQYFLQFLALTLLFGVKWIVDQKAAKTQILIYKALKEEEHGANHSRDLHRTSSRL